MSVKQEKGKKEDEEHIQGIQILVLYGVPWLWARGPHASNKMGLKGNYATCTHADTATAKRAAGGASHGRS